MNTNNGQVNVKQHLFGCLLIILLPLLITKYFAIDNGPMIALFISVVILWFTEIIPLPATGLLIPCLAVAYGISDSKTAFSAFGNQILFLFIGAFLLGKAMQKHGWDRRVAYWILSSNAGARTPSALISLIAALCWLLSMWISNTAACVIAVPIALGILNTMRDNFTDAKDYEHFSIRLLLICAFASSIGGLATPVGTPPNLLALQTLNDNGVSLNFFQWMLIGLPVSFTMLVALLLILHKRFPVTHISLHQVQQEFLQKRIEIGPISKAEKQVATCFLLAICLWVLPGLLAKALPEIGVFKLVSQRLPMGSVAIFASLILFCLTTNKDGEKNLTWNDAGEIDWGTILLFGGGLCLGSMLSQTGLAKDIGEWLFSNDSMSLLAAGLVVICLGILLSEFSSNTASTAILLPIVVATFIEQEQGVLIQLVIATAFGASYGFMLPVSTPPNAIVYGTGKIPLQQMIRTGVFFDLTGFLIIAIMLFGLLPALGLL